MKILDRLLIKAFLKSYLICFVSLLSMYIVVDLFTNLDDLQTQEGLFHVVRQIAVYYSYKAFQIFDRLSEPMVLLAAVFTITPSAFASSASVGGLLLETCSPGTLIMLTG